MEKTRKEPELRFSEFNAAWETKVLGALAEVTTGNKDTQNKDENGVYPFFVRSQNVERINSYSYDGEAILTSGDGVGVGKNFHYIVGKFDYHQRVYCICKFRDQVFGRFIYHYFSEKFNKRVMRMSAKNSVDSVRRTMITEMPVNIPTFPEQYKVAVFLTALEDKIQQLNKKKALLEKYKEGVMQQIFNQEIRFKDNDGKDYPDWEEKSMIDLLAIKYGKDQKQVTSEDGNYPIFGTGGEIGRTNQFLYDQPSVLIGRKGTIDKPRYIDTPFWTVDTLFYTEIKECVEPKWVFYKFQTINWYLYNEASGVPSLSASTINKIRFEVPCLDEQTKIANFLSALDDKIGHVDQQVELTKQYKKGLVQQMFV